MKYGFPIPTVKDLAQVLEIPEVELRQLAKAASTSYWKKEIPKPSGGTRLLTSPLPHLKLIQKKLHKKVFQQVPMPGSSHYGLKGRSNISNAWEHAGRAAIFTFDLKSFFPSVRPERVHRSLVTELGCSESVASIITKLVTADYQLPQGAPTSTDIANVVTLRLQRRLYGLAKQWGLRFTIYADDVTFSGSKVPPDIVSRVKQIVRSEGFKIHPLKGGVFDKSMSQIVTGVNVCHGATVGKVKKKWRAELHQATQKFAEGHITDEERNKALLRYSSRMGYAASITRFGTLKKKG